MRRVGLDGDHKLIHADIANLTHALAAIKHVHAIGKRAINYEVACGFGMRLDKVYV